MPNTSAGAKSRNTRLMLVYCSAQRWASVMKNRTNKASRLAVAQVTPARCQGAMPDRTAVTATTPAVSSAR